MLKFKVRWQSLEHCGGISLFALLRVWEHTDSNLTKFIGMAENKS